MKSSASFIGVVIGGLVFLVLAFTAPVVGIVLFLAAAVYAWIKYR